MSEDESDRSGRRAFLRGGFLRAFGRGTAAPKPAAPKPATQRPADGADGGATSTPQPVTTEAPPAASTAAPRPPDPARTAEERAEAERQAEARRRSEAAARAEGMRRFAAEQRAEASRARRAEAAAAIEAALSRAGRAGAAVVAGVSTEGATPGDAATTPMVSAAAAARPAAAAPAERPAPPPLPLIRPPGAVDEVTFLARCEPGCNKCARVCPVQAISPAGPRLRGARGTPVLTPSRVPCTGCPDHDVPPCIAACPTGALDPRGGRQIGLAHVFEANCLAHRHLVCTTCRERCPVPGAIIFEAGKPVVQQVLCTGCGQCAYTCPAPQRAIDVLPLRQRRTPPAAPRPAAPQPSPPHPSTSGATS